MDFYSLQIKILRNKKTFICNNDETEILNGDVLLISSVNVNKDLVPKEMKAGFNTIREKNKSLDLFKIEDQYVGEMLNGKYHGKGKIITEKYEYNGDWVDGKFSGVGHYIIYDDMVRVYDGEFLNGKYHGYGKQIIYILPYKIGIINQGNWVNGSMNGYGIHHEVGSFIYEGNFKNDSFSGKGRLFDEEKSTIYEGTFLYDNYHGYGKLTYANGNVYEGYFFEGEISNTVILDYDSDATEKNE